MVTYPPPDSRADRFRGALLGVAVGDGLGGPFHGQHAVTDEAIAAVFSSNSGLTATDDTIMTIAVAESLLHTGVLDPDHLAKTFARHWERDPDRGYGPGTASRLAQLSDGLPWRKAAAAPLDGARQACGNGAAMRVAAIAMNDPEPAVAEAFARQQALVTHDHPDAVAGAAVQAAAIAVALTHPTESALDPTDFIETVDASTREPEYSRRLDLVPLLALGGDPTEIAGRLGSGPRATESVPAALCAFLSHPRSFHDAVRLAVSIGGDTNSIAAMTGALSGALNGESAIPAIWTLRIPHRERLQGLADRLSRKAAATCR